MEPTLPPASNLKQRVLKTRSIAPVSPQIYANRVLPSSISSPSCLKMSNDYIKGQYDGFDVTLDAGIATIKFNRPASLNAITRECMRDVRISGRSFKRQLLDAWFRADNR